MSKCKSCGQEIVWLKTTNGKNIPVNVPQFQEEYFSEFTKDQISILKAFGEFLHKTITTAIEFNPSYMVSHFATCPNAKQHRKLNG